MEGERGAMTFGAHLLQPISGWLPLSCSWAPGSRPASLGGQEALGHLGGPPQQPAPRLQTAPWLA